MAALPLGVVGILNMLAWIRGTPLTVPWFAYGMLWLVIPGSYLIAGSAGAAAFWALRPLRRTILGYALTGALLAMIAYGTIGLAMAVFYEPVGRIFLENSSPEEAWALVRTSPPVFGFFGLCAGVWSWFKRDR